MIDTVVPADPRLVSSRRGLSRLLTQHPRVFAPAFQFNLNSAKANVALREGRGRGLVVRDVDDAGTQPPLAVAAWHLSQELIEPPLVTALAPRDHAGDAGVQAKIDLAVVLLLDSLLYIAADRRDWALGRLASARKERERAEARLGVVLVDVADREQLHRYLVELLPGHVQVAARVPSGVTRLRISP